VNARVRAGILVAIAIIGVLLAAPVQFVLEHLVGHQPTLLESWLIGCLLVTLWGAFSGYFRRHWDEESSDE
jgi:hypothetical protein